MGPALSGWGGADITVKWARKQTEKGEEMSKSIWRSLDTRAPDTATTGEKTDNIKEKSSKINDKK